MTIKTENAACNDCQTTGNLSYIRRWKTATVLSQGGLELVRICTKCEAKSASRTA